MSLMERWAQAEPKRFKKVVYDWKDSVIQEHYRKLSQSILDGTHVDHYKYKSDRYALARQHRQIAMTLEAR